LHQQNGLYQAQACHKDLYMSGILSTLIVAAGGLAPPKNVTASAYTTTGFTLSWDNDPAITTYTVHYGPTKTVFSGLTISLTGSTRSAVINNSSFTANTSYDYFVKAANVSGTVFSKVLSVFTNPAAPTGLTAVNGTWAETQFKLTWTNVAGFTYTVWNNSTQITSSTPSPTGTVSTIDPTNTIITNLTPSTGYSFYVKTSNSTGVLISSTVLSVTTPLAHPITATVVNDTQITVSWTNTSGYTFTLWRNTTQLSGWTTASGTNTYTNTSLTANTQYTYYVKATNTFGISTSSVIKTTAPAAPSINYAILTSSSTIQVYLNSASAGATSYTVVARYYYGSSTFTTYNVTSLSISGVSITVPSGNIAGSSNNTAYLISVRAVSANGESAEGTSAACAWLSGVSNYQGTPIVNGTLYTNFGNSGAVSYNMTPTPVSNTYSLTGNWSTAGSSGAVHIYGSSVPRIRIYNYATIWAGSGGGGAGASGLSNGNNGNPGADAVNIDTGTTVEYFYNGGVIAGGGGGGGGGGATYSPTTTYRGGGGGGGSAYSTSGNYAGSSAGGAGSAGGYNNGGSGGTGGTGDSSGTFSRAASNGSGGAAGCGSGGGGGGAGYQASGGLPGGGGGGGGGPGGAGGAGGNSGYSTGGGTGGTGGYAIRNFSKITTWSNGGTVGGALA
jgi:hypothetical protein